VKKLFDIVPDRYLIVVAGIEQFYDLKTLAFDEAVGRLKAFEERTCRGKNGGRSVKGQVLLTQTEWKARQRQSEGDSSGRGKRGEGSWRGRGRGCGGGSSDRGGSGSSSGRGSAADAEKEGTGKHDKSHNKCFKCHNLGHYANRCLGEKKKEEAHLAKVDREPIVLLVETVLPDRLHCQSEDRVQKLFLNEAKVQSELHLTGGGDPSSKMWYLDNGASNHMTGDHKKFRDLNSAISGKVRFGDDSTVEIRGKGTVVFQGKKGDQWVLSDVYYILKLRSNLISLGQLTELGHRVMLDENVLEVSEKHPDRLIMSVPRTQNRLYKIELETVEPENLLACIDDLAWLWHGRLGHVNFRSLK